MTAPDSVLLPDGARLVHIGPHKTGTTTLQGAFHLARANAARQGVYYAGPNRQPSHAGHAIAAVAGPTDPSSPSLRHWRRLVREIQAARTPRAVVSSEWFSDAKPAGIRMLADDFDPDRVHVAVTLRPLGRILSSQWQQLVQAGHRQAFDAWLDGVFREPEGGIGKSFWHRHRHDRLVERWADVVGRDRLTVVVADDLDRGAVLRAFEQLTGLRTGTLVAPEDRANRSLTAAEVELVRQIHVSLAELGIDPATRHSLVLYGVAGHLKLRAPKPDEARIATPRWAAEESGALARQIVDGIRALGVRIVGDLECLALPETAGSGESAPADSPLAEATMAPLAASASIGMLGGIGLARRSRRRGDADGWPDPMTSGYDPFAARIAAPYAGLSTRRLFGVLVSRARGSVSSRRSSLERWLRSRRRTPSVH